MLNNIKIVSNYFFLLFFFPSFVISVAAPNLIIFILIFSTFLFKYKNLIKIISDNKITISVFLVYYLILISSSILSINPIHSLKSSLLYFLYLFYLFSLIILISENKNYEIFFLFAGLVTFLIISVDAIYEIFNKQNFLGNYAMEGRLSGLFGDRWVIGSYLVRLLPIIIGIFYINYQKLSKNFKYFTYFVCLLAIIVIVYSGERTAYLLMLLYSFFMISYFLKKISLKLLFMYFFLIFIIFAIPFFSTEFSNRLLSNIFLYITNFDLGINQYWAMFTASFNMFLDNPIFGIGPNNFRLLCMEDFYNLSIYSCSTHPHNIPLQLASETGILGIIIVYSVFIFFVYRVICEIFVNNFQFQTLGIFSIKLAFIMNIWPLITSGNFFLSWNGYIFFLPCALYIYYSKYYEFKL